MTRLAAIFLAALAAPAMSACTTIGHDYVGPEARPFDADADASAELAAAQVKAKAEGKLVLAVFGANWCHDSRALAGMLGTPRFRALTDAGYEVVYIDAGVPQTGDGRNLDLAARYGVPDIVGTPTVLVLDFDNLLNSPEDARGWRNASTRSADEIFSWLEGWTRR